MKPLRRDEYERMWRVLDQTLTAHSTLRDRYRRRERGLTLFAMGVSIVATAFAFLSPESLAAVGPFTVRLPSWIGILTALIFFITLVDLVLDWSKRARAHEYAVHRLAELKATMRGATIAGETVDTGRVDLQASYEQTMAAVTEIPERQFLALKAKHHRKVELSKLIDSHKGAPLLYLRLLVVARGMRGQKATKKAESGPSESIEESPV